MVNEHEPKLCPDCPRKSYVNMVRGQTYTTTPPIDTMIKLCARLRALDLPGVPQCPYFSDNEKISNFFDCKAKSRLPKRRKRWYEQNEAAKTLVEHNIKKYELFGRPIWMLKLPKGFTCFHFTEYMQVEERHRFAMAIALARPKGALEYDMLEVERAILRHVK